MVLYLEKYKNIKVPNLSEVICVRLVEGKSGRLVTSHQSVLFGPGVLAKFLFGDFSKTIIYNDSDEAKFSFLSDSLNLSKPLEKLTKDDIQQIIKFLDNCIEKYGNINKSYLENSKLFLKILSHLFFKEKEIENFSYLFHYSIVRFLEEFGIKTNFTFMALSEVSKTKDFKDFFQWVLSNYKNFQFLYNEAIDIFRKTYGFFPIKVLNNNEIPFWNIRDNQRDNLYNDKVSNFDSFVFTRPKAVTWAIYRRYFLFDNITDILGIGSSYYNFVADYVVKNILNLDLVDTFVVSLSLPLFDFQSLLKVKSLLGSLKKAIYNNPENLRKIISPLQNIPFFAVNDLYKQIERLVFDIETNIDQSLLEDKRKILLLLEDKNNRSIKKELTHKLFKIREEMNSKLLDYLKTLDVIVDELDRFTNVIKDNIRDYPFFFLDPNEIANKISSIQVNRLV